MRGMRHFGHLDDAERDRLFLHAPEPFDRDADLEHLGVALGATLYSPATRPRLAVDIARRAAQGVVSVVVCLEDAIADAEVDGAERNAVAQLRELRRSGAALPMVFVRIRAVEQVAALLDALGADADVVTGFVVPKFTEDTGAPYFEAVLAAAERQGRRLLAMPVLEAAEIGCLETRLSGLLGARRLVDKYRELVPAVRVGATDLSAGYGLRRSRDLTVWDLRVVADVLAAVVNVFGRVGPDGRSYVVTGPVWEYFPAADRRDEPIPDGQPGDPSADRARRAGRLAADLDGLVREVVLDRANGLTGKTAIHPTHVAAVHALSVVAHEEHADAADVLATGARGGAAASSYGNKMNESKPHGAWARRTMLRARAFGVARPGVSFVDLLAAGLHG